MQQQNSNPNMDNGKRTMASPGKPMATDGLRDNPSVWKPRNKTPSGRKKHGCPTRQAQPCRTQQTPTNHHLRIGAPNMGPEVRTSHPTKGTRDQGDRELMGPSHKQKINRGQNNNYKDQQRQTNEITNQAYLGTHP